MSMLKNQNDISLQRGMPVDPVSDSQKVVSQSESSVQLYYYNSGTLTADAGQAAGTAVVAKLSYAGVLTNIGDVIGSKNDHSLAFTSTALTTEKDVNFDTLENADASTGSDKLNAVVASFANGEYCVDYRTGTIYGKKASTQTALTTVTYKTSTTAANVTLEASDIEIGAVELKDGTTDARATVNAANTARTTATTTVVTQVIDAAGNVISIDAANTARTSSTKVLPVQPIDEQGNIIKGGGASLSAEYISPFDFTVTYTSASTVTITGLPYTLSTGANIVYIRVRNSSTNVTNTYVNGSSGYAFSHSSGVVTAYLNGVAASIFTSGDMYEMGLNGQEKSYDSTLDIIKVVNQSPDRLAYVQDSLYDSTNLAAADNYFPSSTGLSMDGYRDLSLTGKFIDADGTVTLTVEALNDEDATSGDWQQIYGYDAKNNIVANSWTITNGTLNFAIDFDNLNYSTVRFKVVNSGATNTIILKARRKAL